MTGASPWSVKGISAEERDLAKQAARRAGVPIGQWLSRQIREAAELERSGRVPGRAQPPVEGRFGHAPGGWRSSEGDPAGPPQATTAQAGHGATAAAWRNALAVPPGADLPHPPPMHYPPAAPPAPPRPQPPTIDPSRLREVERRVQDLRDLEDRLAALEKLERRIGSLTTDLTSLGARLDDVEKRSEARTAALTREIKALAGQVEELRSQPSGGGDQVGSIAASTAPIERAVMRLAERLQRVEELTLPDDGPGRGLFARLFRR